MNVQRFLVALLGRSGAPEGALDQGEAEGMIAELLSQLPQDAPAALRSDCDGLRLLTGREQATALAAWCCRIEDVLASRAEDPQAFRAGFRERAVERWPRLAALGEMAVAFSPPAELELTLCRFFLREATQRSRDVLGAAGGGRLADLAQWIEKGLDDGVPAPFPSAPVAAPPPSDPLAAAAACSRAFYAWLDQTLGRRAEAIYEGAYRHTARQFGAANAFHVVIGLMPDKLVTADKLSLLRRSQIEQVLREKIALLEQANAETAAAKGRAEAALIELKGVQQNLIHAEKMASLGQLTAGIAHEIKNPLNFVNNFASLSVGLLDELKEALAPIVPALDPEKRGEVDEVMGMLAGNLEKISAHGRRADGIVKSMLAHSRGGGAGERQSVDLNALVDESLNLAYHGARAQDQLFNTALERAYAKDIAPIDLVPQDITRVLLNLFANGFYATNKRKREGGDPSFAPVLAVTTLDLGDAVEVKVRDNGTGIPGESRDRLFQPFFTTKPTGEGTGLGLSISYDIIAQQHGGTIAVDSEVGNFTEFTIRLPRRPGRGTAAVSTKAQAGP